MGGSMPGFPVHHQLPKLPQTHVHWVSVATQPSHSLSSPYPLALTPSQHQSLSNESVLCIRGQSISFSISPSKEHPGLISFRMDWLDLLAVQGTLKSLLQHHSSKVSVLWCSAFFIVQLSHSYMSSGKPIALTRRTFVDKVMSLLLICCLVSFLTSYNILYFKVYFVWYEDCYSRFLLLPICMEYILPSSHFQSICVLSGFLVDSKGLLLYPFS